ncbi:hypothetical protein NNJEOMEG_02128 [Fundidesulfovibrio magnetotacticus]|uniref:Uncharacterized protein n=1 Tax=Fundidesulfovibrio magnetotacticus TaxID=2730080 RepID=A0A6V8LWW0_9BACT|nr:hypothetical protein [Fundidesulfovibrio magnetotacticus]GFK94286.1 hypothetical protein NNJEOMEG_02128 [Fundidesulfovibrio magnetotacticus]
MTKQLSFTRLEQAALPGYRDRLDRASTAEDVRRTFSETVATLLADALGEPGAVGPQGVSLDTAHPTGFALSPALLETPGFAEAWKESDLRRIIKDMAKSAVNRHQHLEKRPEKAQARTHVKQGRG